MSVRPTNNTVNAGPILHRFWRLVASQPRSGRSGMLRAFRSFVAGFMFWLQSSETKEGRRYGNPWFQYRKAYRRHSRSLWFLANVFWAVLNQCGPFSLNLVPSGLSFSINMGPKRGCF